MKKIILLGAIIIANFSISQTTNAFSFDKSEDDLVTVPKNSAYNVERGAFSIEATINAQPSQNIYPQIVSTRGNVDSGFLFGLWSDGRPYMRLNTGNYFYNLGSGTDLRDGKCHHIAFTRDDKGLMTLYVDGQVDATAQGLKNNLSSTHDLWIGNDYQSSSVAFNGTIKEVRFWNIQRSASEITEFQTNALVGNETGLIGYWKLNNDGQEVMDYSPLANDGVSGTSNTIETTDPQFTTKSCETLLTTFNTQENKSIELFPNPTEDTVTILGIDQNTVTELYNTQGYLIAKSNGSIVNMKNLANGIYILKINNQSVKIIKK